MKRCLMMFTISATLGARFVSAQPAQTPALKRMGDSVRVLDSLWAHAYSTHDTTFARNLLVPEIAITATAGNMKNREDEIADVRPQAGFTVNYFRSTGVEVRPYSGAVVVTGLLEWEMRQGGQTLPVTRRRYTATYVRGGVHGFQMVALHIGRAP